MTIAQLLERVEGATGPDRAALVEAVARGMCSANGCDPDGRHCTADAPGNLSTTWTWHDPSFTAWAGEAAELIGGVAALLRSLPPALDGDE